MQRGIKGEAASKSDSRRRSGPQGAEMPLDRPRSRFVLGEQGHAARISSGDAQDQQRQREWKNVLRRNSRKLPLISRHGGPFHFCRIMAGLQIVGDRDSRQENRCQHTERNQLQSYPRKQRHSVVTAPRGDPQPPQRHDHRQPYQIRKKFHRGHADYHSRYAYYIECPIPGF